MVAMLRAKIALENNSQQLQGRYRVAGMTKVAESS
jgi:hypothetical protein